MIKLKQIESGAAITALLSAPAATPTGATYKGNISGANPNLIFPLDAFTSVEITNQANSHVVNLIVGSVISVHDVYTVRYQIGVAIPYIPPATAMINTFEIVASGVLSFTGGDYVISIIHRHASAGKPDMTWRLEVYGNNAGVASGTFVIAKVTPWG